VNERRIENAHVACEEHEVGLEFRHGGEQARIVIAAALTRCDGQSFSMQTSGSCSFESERGGSIREDTDNLTIEVSSATRIV